MEVGAQREIEIGQGLRLDPLSSIDQQDRGFTCLQTPRNLIGEVDVAGCVDHVEHIGAWSRTLFVALRHRPGHPDSLALDGDAAFALNIHPIQILRASSPFINHPGQLEHPIGKGRLAMIDVGDDAKIADDRRVGLPRLGRMARQIRHGSLSMCL